MSILNLPENPVITIIGKPASGKSHLIKYLLHSLQASRKTKSEIILVFSKTKFNQNYNYIPSQWQHSKFRPNVLKSIMSAQSNIREQGYKPPKITLLFDDCVQSATFKTELFQDIVFNHRHYRFTIIMSFQYMLSNTPTFLRENTDAAFVFQMSTDNSLKGIKNAFGTFLTEREYTNMMRELGDHRFIHFDLKTPSAEILLAPPSIPDPKVTYIAGINTAQLELAN